MSERPPTLITIEDDASREASRVATIVELARELFESSETFPFPGIRLEEYTKRIESDKEFPEYSTPTDVILERMKHEGIKVVLGKNPELGTFFILPAGSTDIEMDNILPFQLQIPDSMDARLKRLLLLIKS